MDVGPAVLKLLKRASSSYTSPYLPDYVKECDLRAFIRVCVINVGSQLNLRQLWLTTLYNPDIGRDSGGYEFICCQKYC